MTTNILKEESNVNSNFLNDSLCSKKTDPLVNIKTNDLKNKNPTNLKSLSVSDKDVQNDSLNNNKSGKNNINKNIEMIYQTPNKFISKSKFECIPIDNFKNTLIKSKCQKFNTEKKSENLINNNLGDNINDLNINKLNININYNAKNKETDIRFKRNYGRFLVITLFIFNLYLYFIYAFLNEFQILKSNKKPYLSIIRLFVTAIILILLEISLITTSRASPGCIPLYWGFYIGDQDYKKRRYCTICNSFKPERSHHCSVCNVCVLEMDHHCPWVNNCIGFYNKKFFIQLITYFYLYCFLLSIFNLFFSIDSVKFILKNKTNGKLKEFTINFIIVVNELFLILVQIFLFDFIKFHYKLLFANLTTIENLDKENINNNVYDLGWKQNFLQVFGSNKLFWIIPLESVHGLPLGDGLTFNKNTKKDKPGETCNTNYETIKSLTKSVDFKNRNSININSNASINYRHEVIESDDINTTISKQKYKFENKFQSI